MPTTDQEARTDANVATVMAIAYLDKMSPEELARTHAGLGTQEQREAFAAQPVVDMTKEGKPPLFSIEFARDVTDRIYRNAATKMRQP